MKKTDPLLRLITPDDYDAWRIIWTKYLAFYKESVSEDIYETTFNRLIGDDPWDPLCLVLTFFTSGSERLIGFSHYMFHRHCWKRENVCYLQDLYVEKAYRRNGYGRLLIEGVYSAADNLSSSSVYWMTQENNQEARGLYDSIGTVTPFIKYTRSLRINNTSHNKT